MQGLGQLKGGPGKLGAMCAMGCAPVWGTVGTCREREWCLRRATAWAPTPAVARLRESNRMESIKDALLLTFSKTFFFQPSSLPPSF